MYSKRRYPRVGETWWRVAVGATKRDDDGFSVRSWPIKCVRIKRSWVEWEMMDGHRYKTNGLDFRGHYNKPTSIGKEIPDALKVAISERIWKLFGKHSDLGWRSHEATIAEVNRLSNLFVQAFYKEESHKRWVCRQCFTSIRQQVVVHKTKPENRCPDHFNYDYIEITLDSNG